LASVCEHIFKLDLFFPHLVESASDSYVQHVAIEAADEELDNEFGSPLGAGDTALLNIVERLEEENFDSDSDRYGDIEDGEDTVRHTLGAVNFPAGYRGTGKDESATFSALDPYYGGFASLKARFVHYVDEAATIFLDIVPADGSNILIEADIHSQIWIHKGLVRAFKKLQIEVSTGVLLFPQHLQDTLTIELQQLLTPVEELLENWGDSFDRGETSNSKDSVGERNSDFRNIDAQSRPPPPTPPEGEYNAVQTTGLDKILRQDANFHSPVEEEQGATQETVSIVQPAEKISGSGTHITISRDQTAASNFKRELLLILLSSKLELVVDNEPAASSRPRVPGGPDFPRLGIRNNSLFHPYQSFLNSHPTSAIYHKPSFSPRLETEEATGLQPSRGSVRYIHPKDGYPVLDKERSNITRSAMATSSEENVSMNKLLNRISLLEAENHALKDSQDVRINSEILYFIGAGPKNREGSTAYLDEPTWSVGYHGEVALKAHFPIPDVSGYVKQQHDIAFMVAKFYEPTEQEKEVQQAVRSKTRLPRPQSSSESIRLESESMIEAMEAYVDSRPMFKEQFRSYNVREPIPAPYLFWYYDRSPTAFDGLSESHRDHMIKLTTWIDENYGEMYGRVDTQLQRGFVSYDSVQFLIQPGDAVVVKEKSIDDEVSYTAKIATSSPVSKTPKKPDNLAFEVPWKTRNSEDNTKFTWIWRVDCWTYRYNGSFYRCPIWIDIKIQAKEINEEVSIQDLNAYPLRYTSSGVKSVLEQRGRTFWTCRERRIVSYEDKNGKYGVSINSSSQLDVEADGKAER
jgi:hypothetical protein